MYKIIIGAIFLLFISSCGSSKKYIETQNINDSDGNFSTGLIYNLPKTEIVAVVTVEKIIQSKCPFAEYTQKYLGSLKNVIHENETKFKIANVNFYSIPRVDTLNTYCIGSINDGFLFGINQTYEGFLVSINEPDITYQKENIDIFSDNSNDSKSENYSFNILTSDKNYKIVYDTIYKEQVYDTLIRKIPILKKSVILSSPMPE